MLNYNTHDYVKHLRHVSTLTQVIINLIQTELSLYQSHLNRIE